MTLGNPGGGSPHRHQEKSQTPPPPPAPEQLPPPSQIPMKLPAQSNGAATAPEGTQQADHSSEKCPTLGATPQARRRRPTRDPSPDPAEPPAADQPLNRATIHPLPPGRARSVVHPSPTPRTDRQAQVLPQPAGAKG